jgi:hypothetical protein
LYQFDGVTDGKKSGGKKIALASSMGKLAL